MEEKKPRSINEWRLVARRPGVTRWRLPPAPARTTLLQARAAPCDPPANERWEDEGGTVRKST